jgi:Tfp pilus assembly protein PilO
MSRLKTPELFWLKRYPWCVAFVLVGLLAFAAAWFIWQRLPPIEAELRQRTDEGEFALGALAASPTLRAELAYVREVARRIETNVVDELAVDVNYGYFYSLEKRTQARLSDLKPMVASLPDPRSPYKQVSFSLRLTGSYEQVAEFLRQLEVGPRLVRVTSFAFRRRPAPAGSDQPDSVALDLNVDLLGKR